jgi:hypothetical protein
MLDGHRFLFTERTDSSGRSSILPYLPLILTNGKGAVWENQTVQIPLSGNLAHNESRGLVLTGTVAHFPPGLLAFAWTQSTDVPVILGHMNFFAEFNVCFYRNELAFEVCPIQK